MSEQGLTTTDTASIMERVLIVGDLAGLTPQERTEYYGKVCQSIGLNPLTRPFEYIRLNGKLTLYAKKDCADQLRKINNVSISKPDIQQIDGMIIVTVEAVDATGRRDSDIGVVKKTDMQGDVANAMMKAITKAKRRVTLSICGLGWLDETEVETIPDARPVVVADTGEIVDTQQTRNKVAMRGSVDSSKGDEPFGGQPSAPILPVQKDAVIDAAIERLGGVAREPKPQAAAPKANGNGKDAATVRAELLAELKGLRDQLKAQGKDDAYKATQPTGNDTFDVLRAKIGDAKAALGLVEVVPLN